MTETIEMKETIEAAVETAAKPYTFRKLCASDIVPMTTIIKKIGIKEFKSFVEGDKLNTIMEAFSGKGDEKSVEALGVTIAFELLDIVLEKLPNCEKDIFQLLSQTSNLSVEEVGALGLADFAEMVIDFFKKDDFKDFIKVVSRSFR